jgi:N-acetylglucosaminyldiphosphoundecaprenol N-acetyl-beta-D-mannosaminyltransferase
MTFDSAYILGTRVDQTSYLHATELICHWAQNSLSKYVCVATVNNIMESYDSRDFQRVMNHADLVTPDGMPLVWGLRRLGHKAASRVYGPDLTPLLLEMAAANGLPVGFYGGSQATLGKLHQFTAKKFPNLKVVYAYSPPFRSLTAEEDRYVVESINSSGARILFIGLNTPKQDYWMAIHKGNVQTVMVGVGAAFDFLAGSKKQAPRWMMRIGMEWFFRLLTEPKRLWKRYLKHNPRFVALFAMQLLGIRKYSAGPSHTE